MRNAGAGLAMVLIEGSVGREPSWLDFGGGKRVASFPVAVRRSFNDGKGRVRTEAVYYQIRAAGELAQKAAALKKGSSVSVVGKVGQSVAVNSKGLSVSTVFIDAAVIELAKEMKREKPSEKKRDAAKGGHERSM